MTALRHGLAEFVAHAGWEGAAIGPLPTGRGIVGLLARRTGPLRLARIADHSASVGFPPHHPAMTSFLGSPIVVDGETLEERVSNAVVVWLRPAR